jgi:hypothetical protein
VPEAICVPPAYLTVLLVRTRKLRENNILWDAPVTSLVDLVIPLTPWSRVLLEKLIGVQIVAKVRAFYGAGRFIA